MSQADAIAQMVTWLRERADTSEKGASFFCDDDAELADDMMEDVAKFREAADLLEASLQVTPD